MDDRFPHDPRPPAGPPLLSDPSSKTPDAQPTAKFEATPAATPQISSVPGPENLLTTSAGQPPQADITQPIASESFESRGAKPTEEATGKDATAQRPQTPLPSGLSPSLYGDDRLARKDLSVSDLNPAGEILPPVATDAPQRRESRPADIGKVLPPVELSPAVVRPLAAIDPVSIQNTYSADSDAELDRIAEEIKAERIGSIPQQHVHANAARIRGLKSRELNVKEIYNHLVNKGRIAADKVSYKQFADQVKKLPT